eukprot:s177_g34.t1
MGGNAIRNLSDVHNVALFLVEACHLQRLRAYSLKFMSFLIQSLEADSGLRTPRVLEAQAADKALWQLIHDDQQFTLDNAIPPFMRNEFFDPEPTTTVSADPVSPILDSANVDIQDIELPQQPEKVPPSVQTPVDVSLLQGSRIFLDIFSGAGYPLTSAMLAHNCVCCPVDKLISAEMDSLDNSFFEPLLRVCASGCVGYAAASPDGEYSRLTLPPETLLARGVLCFFAAGGHAHLEQPTNSTAWLEPVVRRFVKFCAFFLVNFPACAYNRNWRTNWLLASTYPALKSLRAICQHAPDSHEQIVGVRNPDGSYKSRATAEYHAEMCGAIATLVSPLCASRAGQLMNLDQVQHVFPIKDLHDLPVSCEDGGGLFSEPDWSCPNRSTPDSLQALRQNWVQILLQSNLLTKLHSFFQSGVAQPPFDEQDLKPFRDSMNVFIQSHGLTANWDVRADQPMHLSIMAALSQIMANKDTTLFPMLLSGAPTGFNADIPPSGCFLSAEDKSDDSVPLSVHMAPGN